MAFHRGTRLARGRTRQRHSPERKHLGVWKAITNPKVLYLAVIYFVYQAGSLGVGYWMPQIIKGFSASLSIVRIGPIDMVPYIAATIVMIWWSRRSDRTGERKKHTYIPLGFAAVGLFLSGLLIGSPASERKALCAQSTIISGTPRCSGKAHRA